MTSSADLVVRDRTLAGHRWMLAIGLGAMLGAIVLGGGGRAAMRGIAMLEDRPRLWSVGGTLRVMAFGAGFGAVAGALRAAIDRWLARLTERRRSALFVALGCGLGVVGLTPLTPYRLALFLPVVALFLGLFERIWGRAHRGAEPREAGSDG